MSFHNKPNYQIPELIEALKAHRLPHDTPSQLADSFRIGWMARASHGQAPAHVLHLVQDAFAEVAMAYPKAFALHKVGIADTAVREALTAPALHTESLKFKNNFPSSLTIIKLLTKV